MQVGAQPDELLSVELELQLRVGDRYLRDHGEPEECIA